MVKLILWIFFSLALVVFAVQNNTPIHLQFLIWRSQNFSLVLLVILSAAVGVILALIASIPTHHRRRKQLLDKERELAALRDTSLDRP